MRRPAAVRLVETHGHAVVVEAIREVIDRARRALVAGHDAVDGADAEARLDESIAASASRIARGTLRPVLNASGVIIHTNLGRAPLAAEALEAITRVAAGYATLEYDVDAGTRGDRHAHAVGLLLALTGAEDALVVNNNAAAILLALTALAKGREVIVSRGELIEIGGGFRVPELLEQSGARLVEVGTTNRTHPGDYARAIGDQTALLLKVHRSNFEITGFTAEVDLAALATMAHARKLPLVYDAGSGCIVENEAGEATVASMVKAGADVVTFSGDKLLGGPQAGIVVGKRAHLERMRKHPLMRAVRPDKTCLAALGATLALWQTAPERVPVARMMAITMRELLTRTSRLATQLAGHAAEWTVDVVPSAGRIGGGAAPSRELAGHALRIVPPKPELLAARLREGDPPIVSRIEDGAVLLDLRCVAEADDATIAQGVVRAIAQYALHHG